MQHFTIDPHLETRLSLAIGRFCSSHGHAVMPKLQKVGRSGDPTSSPRNPFLVFIVVKHGALSLLEGAVIMMLESFFELELDWNWTG